MTVTDVMVVMITGVNHRHLVLGPREVRPGKPHPEGGESLVLTPVPTNSPMDPLLLSSCSRLTAPPWSPAAHLPPHSGLLPHSTSPWLGPPHAASLCLPLPSVPEEGRSPRCLWVSGWAVGEMAVPFFETGNTEESQGGELDREDG